MEIFVSGTYQQMSVQAAEDLINLMQASQNKLLCIASGDTPSGMYKEIVAKVEKGALDISDWNFVGLDEWVGMNGQDEGSCRYHLDKQFFYPLQINPEKICFFNGRAADLEKECAATGDFIKQRGGTTAAILGIGSNGHIGMNEPGTSILLHSHVAEIATETQAVGQKYFTTPQRLSHGITVGIADLMEAKHVLLLASGSKKAAIIKKVLEEEISEALPATVLRRHAGFKIYLDAEAAKEAQPS